MRQPYDRSGVLSWLGARAVPGVEQIAGSTYRRSVRLPGGVALAALEVRDSHVLAALQLSNVADAAAAVSRCRRLLDLDADPAAYAVVLAADPMLRTVVTANPGLRAPGSVDGVEATLRAVLGQGLSVDAARQLAARVVAAHGRPLDRPSDGVTHAFPSAAELADAALDIDGLTETRRKMLRELARRLAAGEVLLDVGSDRDTVRRQLLEIPGVTPTTATHVAMHALGDPDAFPADDVGLQRAASARGMPSDSAGLLRHADRWRPWRTYAAHCLWRAGASTAGSPVDLWPPNIFAPGRRFRVR
jgi:AraC family transcriptional regulator of adaptative response / DNA-3-methyladenine glycosylase II